MLKKLLVLMLVFVGAITLAGCETDPEGLTDAQKLEAALADLSIVTETGESIAFDVEGLNGATITWTTANADLIAADGTVTQPSKTDGDQQVLVTALITIGDIQTQKEFIVTILATTNLNDLEKLAVAVPALELPAIVADDMVLPTAGLEGVTISWASNNDSYIMADGTVMNPTKTMGNVTVTLRATFTSGTETFNKDFDVEVSANEELTDMEILDNAKGVILLTASGNVESDFVLPAQAAGIDIVWTSGNTDLITIDGLNAVITRPASDAGNQDAVLTATLTQNGVTVTKDFTVSVKAVDPANTYASIAAMHESAIIGEVIEFEGTVIGIFATGYFLSDGTNSLGVYKPETTLTGLAIGDLVTVKGSYAVYNTLYQLSDVTNETLVSTGNANPLAGTETVVTVAELLAVDSSDALIHGMYYTVSGTIELQGSYDNVYIVDGDAQVLVYYASLDDSLAALEAEVGKDVTITVFYYTNHGSNGPMVAFDGGAADISINTLPDADALAADIAALENVPGVTLTDIVLPTVGPNGTMFSAWVSNETDRIASDGTFGTVGTVSTVVTFTSTATIGLLTETVTVDVLVPVNSTVAEVLAMDDDAYFQVSGVIYDISYYGLFIEEGGNYIFIYSKEYAGPAVVGDEVSMLGAKDSYSGLAQIALMSDMTVLTSSNAVPTAVVGTIAQIVNNEIPRGTVITITGTVSVEGSYDNVYITDAGGTQVGIYYRSNADEIATMNDNGTPDDDSDDFADGFAGQRVTVTVITYQNGNALFSGMAADVTVAAAATDAEKVADALTAIDLMDMQTVEMDVTLPTSNANGVALVWVSSDAAVVATDGTVVRVAGADTTVTLTVTATLNAETADLNISLIVLDANDMDALSVADALLEADDASVLVTGVITGKYYDERVIQGPDGSSIWVDSNIGGEIGDEIIVRGTLDTYDTYGNASRKLKSASLISTTSTGNTLVVDAETSVTAIYAEFGEQRRYTATLTITEFDSFGAVLFNTVDVEGDQENGFKFSISQFAPHFADVYMVGDMVEITFTILDFSYNNVRMVNVMVPELTEAQNMLAAKGSLEVAASVVEDLTPVLAVADYNATITWASDTIAVIANDGTVVRPAIGELDATVVLTATITVGALTETMDFTVTVPAEVAAGAPDLFISEYIEGSSNNKALEFFNPTGADLDLTGYVVSYYNNGSATPTKSFDLTGTLTAGDVFVICTDSFDGLPTASAANAHCDEVQGYNDADSVVFFNGDDAIALFKDGVMIDVIGLIGEDPGSNWTVGTGATNEFTLVRTSSVTYGVVVFDPTQWVVNPQNTFTNLGAHTVD